MAVRGIRDGIPGAIQENEFLADMLHRAGNQVQGSTPAVNQPNDHNLLPASPESPALGPRASPQSLSPPTVSQNSQISSRRRRGVIIRRPQAQRQHNVPVRAIPALTCPVSGCDRVFTHTGTRRNHFVSVHGPGMICGICSQRCSTGANLRRHMLNKHSDVTTVSE